MYPKILSWLSSFLIRNVAARTGQGRTIESKVYSHTQQVQSLCCIAFCAALRFFLPFSHFIQE